MTCIQKPGFGKYDLDSGLSNARKYIVRNSEGNYNYTPYEKYVFEKEEKKNHALPSGGNEVELLLKNKSHGDEVKNGETLCTHLEEKA